MGFDPVLGPLGLLLLYAAPGLGLAFACFPEKFSRTSGVEEVVEMGTLTLVASVAITILLGSLLAASPGGFTSTWSAPGLLLADLGVAGIGGAVGAARRSLGAAPPVEAPPSDADGWRTLRTLESLASEERRVRRALRTAHDDAERSTLESRLEHVRSEREALRKRKEAEFAA